MTSHELAAWEACGGRPVRVWTPEERMARIVFQWIDDIKAQNDRALFRNTDGVIATVVSGHGPAPESPDGEMFPGPIRGVDDWSKSPF